MITLIKYGMTKNTGDYNSERIDAEYAVGETENPVEAMAKLKMFVATGSMECPSVITEEPKKEVKKKAPAKKKVEAPVKNEVEVKVEEDIAKASQPEPKQTKEEKEEVKEVAKKKATKKTVKKAKKVAGPILYSREEKDHKTKLASILNDDFAGWKKDADLKARAKEVSSQLEGEPIFCAKGVLLDSFIEAVREGMLDDTL